MDNVSSPWDICRSFGPQDDEDLLSRDGLGGMTSVMTKEEDREIEKEDKGVDGKLETIFWSFGPQHDEELCSEDGFGGTNSVMSREEGQEMSEEGGVIEQGKGVDTKVDMDRLLLRDNSVVSEIWSDTSNDGKEEESVNAETVEPPNGISPNGEFKHRIKCWQKGDFLGRGSFGTVYEGFTDDGFFFAVKEVSLLDQGSHGKQSIFQLEQEISLLSQFEHENIVRYFGTDKDDSKLYIFLELVTKGSLASLYQKYNLRDSQVSVYTRQILSGLNYLHCRNVVHRDIKCANILVDASGSVELADFGLAKATKLNDIKSLKGSAFWMAPEVVNQKKQGYGLAADIWSLGCTVLEMLTRKIPYSHLGGVQALFQIGCGQLPLIPTSLSIDAQDFILKCLQVNPDNRPTPAQLLDHPFVKQSSILAPPSPYRIGTKAKSFESPKSLNLDTHVNGDRSREGERDDCNESRVSVGCSRVGGYGIKGLNPAEIQARVRNIDEVVHDYNESGVSGRCNNRVGGCGIMGTRPAALAPPPAISLPVMDNVSSPWDVCRSSPGSSAIPGGGEIAGFIALSSSGFAATTNRANLLGQNPSGSTAYHSNKKRRRDAAVDKGTNLYVSEQDLRQHFGLTREEAARCLGVSVTTFKRHCRKHGILRWPCYRNRSSDIPGRPPDLHMVPPDFFDDLGACLETPISSFLEEIAASGSYEAEFLPPEQITVSFAYPTHNHPVCAQPRIASKEMASENTRSSDLTTQVEAHSEGHGSGSNYLTVPTFSNPALSQPVSSISETGPTVPQHISTIPGIGPSQLEARLEARGSGSSYLTVPTSSNPSSTQPMSTIPEPGPAIPQPVSTIPVTGPTIPHIMPPLIAQQDMRPVTIKAKYSDSIVRFKLPLTSGLAELNKNVAKRLNLRFDSFDVEYWDEEGLWILISCDEDLRDYLQLFSSLDNPVIKLSVLDKVVNANESSGSFKRKRPWDA